MRNKTALYIIGGTILALLLLPILAQEYAFRGTMGSMFLSRQQRIHKQFFRYERVQKSFSDFDVYRPSTRDAKFAGKDAGAYLNPKVRWNMPEGARAQIEGSPPSPILLPERWIEIFKSGKATLGRSDLERYSDVNFKWLKDLTAFDYWELSDAEPQKKYFEFLKIGSITPFEFFGLMPLPSFIDLRLAAQVRLMQALKTRHLPQALAEIRHLARLCYSTETMEGNMTSTALLLMEEQAYLEGVKRKQLRKQDWKPVNSAELVRDGFVGIPSYYSIASWPEYIDLTLGNPKNVVGRCVTIMDGMKEITRVMPYLNQSWPLERDFSQIINRLKDLAMDPNTGCRLTYARAYWSEFADISERSTMTWGGYLYTVPYLRRIAALSIMATP